jgi:uncharacterized protein YejL (UPF0352 family)
MMVWEQIRNSRVVILKKHGKMVKISMVSMGNIG